MNTGSRIYHMTDEDIAKAEQLGTDRQEANLKAGIVEDRRDGRTDNPVRLHILGAWAEVGWAGEYGLDIDLSTTPRRHTPDFVMDGKRIDIKASDANTWRGKHGGIVCNIKKNVTDVDFYVLAIVDFDNKTVEFLGWASSKDLINPARIKNLAGRPTYVVERDELRKFDTTQKATSVGAVP